MEFQLSMPQAIHELGQRGNQEDTIFPVKGEATPSDRLFIVCDGMGGHDGGEVASGAVCQGLSQKALQLYSPDAPFSDLSLCEAQSAAYDSLDAADTTNAGRMGTTMTLLCLHRGGAVVAHIGDSRIYHLRPKRGSVLYRSRDHSLVQQLYELGEISYDEMATSPRKNVILKAMQPHQEERIAPTITHITDIQPGDYFYLCTDGMLEKMEDDELLTLLANDSLTDEQKAAALVERTVGNHDNHSAYLVRIEKVTAEAGDDELPSDEEEARRKNKILNDNRRSEVWDFTPAVGANASERLEIGIGANASERLDSGVATLGSVASYDASERMDSGIGANASERLNSGNEGVAASPRGRGGVWRWVAGLLLVLAGAALAVLLSKGCSDNAEGDDGSNEELPYNETRDAGGYERDVYYNEEKSAYPGESLKAKNKEPDEEVLKPEDKARELEAGTGAASTPPATNDNINAGQSIN